MNVGVLDCGLMCEVRDLVDVGLGESAASKLQPSLLSLVEELTHQEADRSARFAADDRLMDDLRFRTPRHFDELRRGKRPHVGDGSGVHGHVRS